MDIRKVKKLMELLEESGMSEIEIKEGEESVKISRYGNSPAPAQHPIQSFVQQQAPVSSAPTSQTASPNEQPQETGQSVTSPMVGTFYSAPSPTAKPFVSIGQKINQGDTVGIIEAMKIMNQIESDQSGTVIEILVKDGEAVEFGQSLIVVE
ncbi:acetyl-CoA carboxylase biotin carboxyl carrier protein [Candidatus Pseudothioglobus singularis]|jgi:acetyl-CoA carboxylase biotin carboxyl carrier protein|uniref:Biotin carboxyl carrier protein of acetyl-CoA carboxylase n=1 Tax=Candidatus Pseudothioglobus singularis PS1 TaxID=1125411 RepID=A0A0M4LF72_9GAMM|nr:acetyl-CoA carboxylase biotin carboxyl carrier protein [Candidatus Pseudothioglobus singularis]MDP0560352.1 acetyl-CoA carboxylase biotin carboxyl carrier protein [Candidatus Thioglobus sp.]ALE01164.1 acetyl-CoA carboxylase biotin carboxyl carrier protein [Candidatus Pseudothioglobus singularis PS1]ANQ65809.1 acetyl-CoA carboxylase [Candidatus Pseudothioglobus singularis]MDA8755587.1 acetyl-CoA carboxylase biotin carboxyl carrier protein [Candidatus Pseudothioglobus singularis]MDA9030863.1 |tara:strand:- start:1513 stop:1968 length:456 start_codon:yes stop_codon:yes gene_type:complete